MNQILVIDDSTINLRIVKDSLSDEFQVYPVTSGMQGLEFLKKKIPDIILLDLNMPDMDGKETLTKIRLNPDWEKIPIIFLTSDSSAETEAECIALGADDYLAKPFVPIVMKSRIKRTLDLTSLKAGLENQLGIKTKQIEKLTLNSIMTIAKTIDAKDKYTSGHSVRVAKCAEAIARQLGWEEKDILNLHYISLLHDIGKIGIPDAILNKTGRLTEEEYNIIKQHPTIGGEILKDIKMIPFVSEGAFCHHERYDGNGYPRGLKGDEIPIPARIVSIADAYDAMTSHRIYRKKLSHEEVLNEFTVGLGTQFDPSIGKVFIEMLKNGFDSDSLPDDSFGIINQMPDESNMLLNKVLAEYTSNIQSIAMTDSLTGLYNRSFMEGKIAELINNGHTGALFMLDMDNFKSLNDKFGHIAGDNALKIFADTLTSCVREKDYAGRIGGDEFVVFIPDIIDRNQLEQIAKRLILRVSESLEKFLNTKITSVSIGIAMAPNDGCDYMTLYKNADRALYHTKENGKNNFHFFRDKIETVTAESADSTHTDLATVEKVLKGNIATDKGAYAVNYADFQKIFQFISRYVDRNRPVVQAVLFTMHSSNGDYIDSETADDAMGILESAIVSSLRAVDVTTRYSSIQYIVILMNADYENGKMVADRVCNVFYSTYGAHNISLSYAVKSIEPMT